MGAVPHRAKPGWHWQALALYARGVPMAQVALECGKARHTCEKVLYSAWGKEQRRELVTRVNALRMQEAVDPLVKFQAAGSEMADIMLQAAKDEQKPLKKALIAEKNLALGGWVAVTKSMTLNVEARIRDREAIPDHLLEAFANGGEMPDALRPLLVQAEQPEE